MSVTMRRMRSHDVSKWGLKNFQEGYEPMEQRGKKKKKLSKKEEKKEEEGKKKTLRSQKRGADPQFDPVTGKQIGWTRPLPQTPEEAARIAAAAEARANIDKWWETEPVPQELATEEEIQAQEEKGFFQEPSAIIEGKTRGQVLGAVAGGAAIGGAAILGAWALAGSVAVGTLPAVARAATGRLTSSVIKETIKIGGKRVMINTYTAQKATSFMGMIAAGALSPGIAKWVGISLLGAAWGTVSMKVWESWGRAEARDAMSMALGKAGVYENPQLVKEIKDAIKEMTSQSKMETFERWIPGWNVEKANEWKAIASELLDEASEVSGKYWEEKNKEQND